MNKIILLAALLNTGVQLTSSLNSTLCCENSQTCHTNLNNAMMNISSSKDKNLNISFCDQEYIISNPVDFKKRYIIRLTGEKTLFKCTTPLNSGLRFYDVTSIVLKGLTFMNCGAAFKMTSYRKRLHVRFITAIGILASTKVLVSNVIISNSLGTGLAIVSSGGHITIKSSVFNNGHSKLNYSGGGGLYIFIKSTNMSKPLNISISKSVFCNNSVYYTGDLRNNSQTGLGNGGGFNIFLEGVNKTGNISIVNCTVDRNRARYWGGGMVISLKRTSYISITVDRCNITHNSASKKGGGGADIALIFGNICPKENQIIYSRTRFENNSAEFGGGVYVISTAKTCLVFRNIIKFERCSWIGNKAVYAAAIQVAPQLTTFNRDNNLPNISFENCLFYKNRIQDFTYTSNFTLKHSKGVFYSSGFSLIFHKNITFRENSGTALYLVSSTVEVRRRTVVNFYENTGLYGGAIAFYSSSTLNVRNNVAFNFVNNKADVKGGAVYQDSSKNIDGIVKTNCFLTYIDKGYIYNISFKFSNNSVDANRNCSDCGKTLFITSTNACTGVTRFNPNCNRYRYKATFTFEYPAEIEISTQGNLTLIENSLQSPLLVVPGKPVQLPIKILNDYGLEIKRLVQIVVINLNKSSIIKTDSFSSHIFNQKSVTLLGNPGSKGNTSLSLSSFIDREIRLPIQLLECPPGYVFREINQLCQCSANIDLQRYIGLSHCKTISFQAVLKRSHWMGYIQLNDSQVYGKEKELHSAQCPTRYCSISSAGYQLSLPNTSNATMLDELVCGPYRTGIICAKCRENNSVFYHTERFECFPDYLCQSGWFLYFISEIFPVTALFTVITLLNIKLTSGHIQGFILYAQMFNTLLITANGQIVLNKSTSKALQIIGFIYRMFDLEFFTTNKFSFCLWKNASSLDVLSMKYVTMIYSLLLVVAVVVIFKKSSLLEKLARKVFKQSVNNVSIIHGLSGFLILCYSQCTKVSLLILTPTTLYTKGPVAIRHVSFYDGSLTFLRGSHLIYAIPAIVSAVTLIMLPPLLFFIYPLCYKVFKIFRIQESSFSRIACTVIPLEKFKPFFDSFQGSFKDEYRYFAGLYFLYRLIALMSFVLVHELSSFYNAVQILLVLMLLLHAWVQPYKQKVHNYLDACIFALLALINHLTQYNYSKTQESGQDINNTFFMITSIQVALAYLPLIYVVLYYSWKICTKFSPHLMKIVLELRNFQKKDEQDILLNLQEGRKDSDTLATAYSHAQMNL